MRHLSFAAVALVFGAALLLASCRDSETSQGSGGGPGAGGPPAAAGPVQVGYVTLQPQLVPFTAVVPGRTVASAVAEIRPQVNGIIQKRLFREGSEVRAGDVLYQIDDRTYRAAVESAQASVERAQAAFANAQAEFGRTEQLRERNVTSQQAVDTARAAMLQAQADVAVAEASLQTEQINLDRTKVTSPISGLIGTSLVTEGALVTANQAAALTTVRQIDPMFVDLTETGDAILRVRRMINQGSLEPIRQAPTIHLILPDGSPYSEVGTIQALEAAVSETTGTVTIRAKVPNPNRILMPGFYVRATVEVGSGEQAFLVPQRAVSRNPRGQATAMFISADGKAEIRVLQTDHSHGNAWVVRESIANGDRLIVEGLQRVRSGQPVDPVEVQLDEQGVAQPVRAQTSSSQ